MQTRAFKAGPVRRFRIAFEWRSWLIGFGAEPPGNAGFWSAHLLCLAVISWKVTPVTTRRL